MKSSVVRKIIHIDMDCFFAAVEIRDRPDLADKPVAVGGSGRRGVLTTCNYEARKYGCHSGMPGFKALELCPKLILLPVNFDKYIRESEKINAIFMNYTDLVESLSLDEAFLDVSHIQDRYAWEIAKEIRAKIYEDTGLTASAGIAPNKMLAKIASDWRKPNGQYAIVPEAIETFMKALPVGKIWGVGQKTKERLALMGIHSFADLQQLEPAELDNRFGKFGGELYHLCRGVDERPVVVERVRKSMSIERTFQEDLSSVESALVQMALMCDELSNDFRNSRHHEREIGKIFVKLKFSDFQTTTKECLHESIDPFAYEPLLREAWLRGNGVVRLIGVGIRFAEASRIKHEQMSLSLRSDSPDSGLD
jgi:DNA polymerase IV